jgi:hypothetical protein
MDEQLEEKIRHLVHRLEARRAVGMPTKEIDDEIAELKREHGPRKITGEAHITIPVPKTEG